MITSRLRPTVPAAILLLLGAAAMLRAEDYAIVTLVGTSNVSGSADGTPGSFRNPYGIAIDAAKNLYVSDTLNNTIRKITPARVVSTLAGSAGTFGSTDGTAGAARFNFPVGLAADSSGNVYVADSKNFTIRKITAAGVVSTYAGAPFLLGANDGPIATARFFLPYGVAVDSSGNVYVADGGNHVIRKITAAGVVSTLAGAALQSGFTDGSGAAARFSTPWGVAVDTSGNVFVADSLNNAIRKVTPAGVVTTYAGNSGNGGGLDGAAATARFNQPRGLSVDATGTVLVADYGNSVIRLITPGGTVSTLAGATGIIGEVDSVGSAARFYDTTDVVADGSTIYVVDSSNNLIRKGVPASLATLPVILIEPLDQEVSVGQAVTFRVVASGSALTYRWLKNGGLIAGATSASYTIAAAQAADVGTYSVRIAGAGGGSVDSAPATLSVTAVGTGPIAITARPLSQNVSTGQSATLSVTATGAGLTFQWLKNGSAISGATSANYTLPSVQATDAGTYAVRLTSGGTTVTASAKLSVGTGGTVAINITTQPTNQTVNAGQGATFAVTATGSTALAYQWFKNDQVVAGATNSSLAIGATQTTDAGNYTVRVSGGGLNVSSEVAVLTVNVVVTGPTARLSNLSVRTAMGVGQTLIVGVVVSGGSRNVLVRAAGPALAAFGLSSAMSDPRLELYNGPTQILANDSWPATLADTFASVGAFGFPAGSSDAAFVQGIDGARSIWALGTGAGVVLVEAYDTGTGNTPRLVNVSARNQVGTGDNILIAGFNIAGTGTKRLLIRAVGPTLAAFGVTGLLVDPKLEVYDSAGVKVTENDTWDPALAVTFSAVGAFSLNAGSRDAALLTTLAAGGYTVWVRGSDGGTGEALVEIYEVL